MRRGSKGKQIALLTYIVVATVAVLLLVVIAFSGSWCESRKDLGMRDLDGRG